MGSDNHHGEFQFSLCVGLEEVVAGSGGLVLASFIVMNEPFAWTQDFDAKVAGACACGVFEQHV